MLYIIGGGGVGSWLAALTPKLEREVTVIDGDRIEKKNLDRQLFDLSDIGSYKAMALAKYGVTGITEWFSERLMPFAEFDLLICAADNHPCRRATLRACDINGCSAIIAANETTSAEAYYYEPKWQGTPIDPRVYYPEIESDTSGDPRARAIGCTGDAQEQNRQLASANFMAAGLAAHLHMIWRVKAKKLNADARQYLPYLLNATISQLTAKQVKDGLKGETTHA